jgi:hypothetical protein
VPETHSGKSRRVENSGRAGRTALGILNRRYRKNRTYNTSCAEAEDVIALMLSNEEVNIDEAESPSAD